MKQKALFPIVLCFAIVQGIWAQIGVSTERELLTAVANGGSVVMTADIQLGSALKIENGKTVTLDLNGKTLSTPQ